MPAGNGLKALVFFPRKLQLTEYASGSVSAKYFKKATQWAEYIMCSHQCSKYEK